MRGTSRAARQLNPADDRGWQLERELAHMLDPSAGMARLEARVGAPLRPPEPPAPSEENP